MYELVVMVCLLANESDCKEFRVYGTETDNIATCMKATKDKAEAWLKKHDTYKFIGVRCAKDAKAPFAPGDKP